MLVLVYALTLLLTKGFLVIIFRFLTFNSFFISHFQMLSRPRLCSASECGPNPVSHLTIRLLMDKLIKSEEEEGVVM